MNLKGANHSSVRLRAICGLVAHHDLRSLSGEIESCCESSDHDQINRWIQFGALARWSPDFGRSFFVDYCMRRASQYRGAFRQRCALRVSIACPCICDTDNLLLDKKRHPRSFLRRNPRQCCYRAIQCHKRISYSEPWQRTLRMANPGCW